MVYTAIEKYAIVRIPICMDSKVCHNGNYFLMHTCFTFVCYSNGLDVSVTVSVGLRLVLSNTVNFVMFMSFPLSQLPETCHSIGFNARIMC